MTARRDRVNPRVLLGVLAMAVLAYVPGLVTASGILPADTKLYLSVDPGRLLAAAPWLWDNSQFGGWVTHQTIGYLWPTGPWYWVLEHLGAPAWVAQRLWVGTLFLAAGTGVWWCARRLGLSHRGGWAAGLVYQLSPYVLPYVSRTSVLLSPWAGLGWLVGLTILAGRRGGWRYPAIFALVVATVGGINATAIALIAVAPLLWLASAALVTREIPWRRALAAGARLGALSLFVSLWWLVALLVQSRYGADVLAYSETIQAVSSTSLASEVMRGLGYWLFYGGDVTGWWTGASPPYVQSLWLIGLGFLLAAGGLLGILLVRWRERAFLAGLVVAGTVLAVGAHGASPLANALQGSARSTLVLALRSSTRAVPLLLLGLSLGLAALLTAWSPRLPRATLAASAAVALLAIVNLPALHSGDLVDPVLRHPEDLPAWWHETADALDATGAGHRMLELPGAEFAAHRWGITIDPVMPGLADRPTIARDLLPLGSAAVMDLLYALDDRFQGGVAERSSIAPVARMLGADEVLFRGDIAFDKYQNPRPGEVWGMYADGGDGLGQPRRFGPEQPNRSAVAMDDETALSSPTAGQAVPQLALVPVAAAPAIVRAADGRRAVVLAGNGDGVVDAAAAGLLDGDELLQYSADVTDRGDVPAGALLVVTDTNRKQARQWRGSQDTRGFTEDEGAGVLEPDEADHRLPIFGDDGGGPAEQTLAEQRGPIRATASGYGSAVAYWPEDRAAMAVDGDPRTAWTVGDRANVIGERLRLDLAQERDLSSVHLVQPLRPANRRITEVRVRTEAGERTETLTDASSTLAGQDVALPPGPSSWVEIEITDATGGRLTNYVGVDAVGFAEVGVNGPDGPVADEVVRVPTALLADLGAASLDHPLAFVFTRDRVDARKRWRDDPEPALVRSFTVPTERSFSVGGAARLSPRAADDVLGALLGTSAPAAVASSRLAGVPAAGGHAAIDGDPNTAWQTAFGPAAGARLDVILPASITVDHLELQVLADGRHSVPTSLSIATATEQRDVTLPPIADAPGAAPAPVRVEVPPLTGDRLSVTVTGTRDVSSIDRRTGEPVVQPVGISELGIPGVPPAAPLPTEFDSGCRSDLLTVDGQPFPIHVVGDVSDAVAAAPLAIEACGTPPTLSLASGEHILRATPGRRSGLDLDRIVLTSAAGGEATNAPLLPAPTADGPVATVTSSDHTHRHVSVEGGDGAFWLVLGEGVNRGWHASADGKDLGPPQPVDGGMNAWHVPRSGNGAVTVDLTWVPQRQVWIGLGASVLGVLVCLVLAIRRPRQGAEAVEPPVPLPRPLVESAVAPIAWRPLLVAAAVVGVATALFFHPVAAPLVVSGMLLAGRLPRARSLCALASAAAALATGAYYVLRQWHSYPLPGFGWPSGFERGHSSALAAVALLAADVALSLAAGSRAPRGATPPAH